ncbi:ANTAR domain-containing protein [Streptomyces sp. AGS-58]|uniref:ANTAR domain-containing protein n=1 Tax=unclassified Streptomyces TaxID=2593676 RepID=UPI0035A3A8D6
MIGCDEQADRLDALREEVAQLRRALVSHALVDQAIGVVIARAGLRPQQGWDVLKHVSQHTNTKMREVARCLVEWPSSGRLPDVIRRALPAAVRHVRAAAQGPGEEREARHAARA